VIAYARASRATSLVVAVLAGVLFGIGLGVAGMTRPEKVTGFLDFGGQWDPSLGLVMAGAIGVHFALLRLVRRRSAPLFEPHFHLPTRTDITFRLALGAALFGVGWGLAGYCPGPAVVAIATGTSSTAAFAGAMAAGMILQHVTSRESIRPKASSHEAP
jgi:uncharacterized membrane protein YedE/YeeE